MTRQWTIEELDRVHPLPDGWLWSKRGLNTWCARKAEGGCWMDVWVAVMADAKPALLTECVFTAGIPKPFMPPADVALAVLLAIDAILAGFGDDWTPPQRPTDTDLAELRAWIRAYVERLIVRREWAQGKRVLFIERHAGLALGGSDWDATGRAALAFAGVDLNAEVKP